MAGHLNSLDCQPAARYAATQLKRKPALSGCSMFLSPIRIRGILIGTVAAILSVSNGIVRLTLLYTLLRGCQLLCMGERISSYELPAGAGPLGEDALRPLAG
jgi:hypothetical protein